MARLCFIGYNKLTFLIVDYILSAEKFLTIVNGIKFKYIA
jgi:hypothetical protein